MPVQIYLQVKASPFSSIKFCFHVKANTDALDMVDTMLEILLVKLFPTSTVLVSLVLLALFKICQMLYRSNLHVLSKIPGPRFPAASSLWIRWQRWHGRLSFKADSLLSKYGPIVRIAPNMVLVNDVESVQTLFVRQDLDTAPKSIRALRIGGHDWTVTYPENAAARSRRRPVMMATTTKALRYWQPNFERNTVKMISALGRSHGRSSEDIVYHLRVATFLNSQAVMAGTDVNLDPGDFPHVVGEYNFLVVWRLCVPELFLEWLKWSPFRHAAFRVRSSDSLLHLGREIVEAAEKEPEDGDISTIYQLLVKNMKLGDSRQDNTEISAEMAGQILAATETTSSALAFILYYLARDPTLVDAIYDELRTVDSFNNLEGHSLLNACITEGLRFRPPVALTGSRVVPPGGLQVLGYYLPAGTVVTTQSLSLSRQRPDLFPNYDQFDPMRWLDQKCDVAERRRCLAPFGIGARRCPGGNMATYQMRMILAAVIRAFRLSVAPETTPLSMAPFEANGFRSQRDECYLVFTPRDLQPQPGPKGCECGSQCDCVECLCVHYEEH